MCYEGNYGCDPGICPLPLPKDCDSSFQCCAFASTACGWDQNVPGYARGRWAVRLLVAGTTDSPIFGEMCKCIFFASVAKNTQEKVP